MDTDHAESPDPGTEVVTWSYSGSPEYKPSDQAKAAHDNQITYIKNVHQPLLDLCQKNINQARENKDEDALTYWKKAYNDYAKVQDEQLAAENKRYQQYVNTLAAGDQTLFSISATQPKPLGLQQIVYHMGPGSGKISFAINGGEGYYFTVTAQGPWKITVTMTK